MSKFNPKEIYWNLIHLKAAKLGSDGCTAVSEWNQRCCFQHDIHYRTGHLWKLHLRLDPEIGPVYSLQRGNCVTRKMADQIFYQCNRTHSPGKLGHLRAKARHWGVRIMPFAWLAWRRYRKADGIKCPGGK